MRSAVVCVAAVLLAHPAWSQPSQDSRAGIIGTWEGTSLCTDRVAAPACNDEQVIYEISATAGKPDAVTVKADKIVNGKREPMGDIEFTPGTAPNSWTSDLVTPRMRAVWTLTVSGTTMSGNMTLVPSKAMVRKIALKRAQGSV